MLATEGGDAGAGDVVSAGAADAAAEADAAGAAADAAAPPAFEADPACCPVAVTDAHGLFSTPLPNAYGLGMKGFSKDSFGGLGSFGTGVAGIGFADAAVSPPGYAADAAGFVCGGVIGEGFADAADVVVLTDPAAEAGLALTEKEAPCATP